MGISLSEKDNLTEKLRQTLLKNIAAIQETDSAEMSLCNLSFQSRVYPERHIWIDTDCDEIDIDLEDWQDEDETEWDNAIARVRVDSLEEAIEFVRDWVIQPEIHYYYYNLNKNYEKVWHIRHVRAQIAKAIENKNLEIQKFLGLTDIQFSDLISQAKKQKKQTKLTPREQLTLTLFHLHYSLSFQKLGFLFDVSEATARKWYKYWIELLDKQIQGSSQNTQKTGKEWIEEVLEPIYQKELKTA